jgi:hypothetical protein
MIQVVQDVSNLGGLFRGASSHAELHPVGLCDGPDLDFDQYEAILRWKEAPIPAAMSAPTVKVL